MTRDKVLWVFLAIILFITLVVNFTFETLAVVTLLYLALIPVSVRRYRSLDRDWKASLEQKVGEGGAGP